MFPKSACSIALTLGLLASHASADTIELTNGDTLTGTIVETTDDAVVLEHETLGKLTIAKDRIKPEEAGPQFNASEQDAQEAANEIARFFDSWLFPGWKKSFAAGFNGSDGNTETLNLYANFKTDYEDETDRWAITADYFRNSDDGDTTENEFKGTITKDWLKPDSPWFTFANGLYQYDQFESWEHRAGGFLGVGHECISGPVHTVRARVGAGAQYEFGDVNELTPEGLIGVEWEWLISDAQSFNFYNTLYPSLDPGFSEFRNVTGAAWEVKLAAGDGLKLRIGAENEYESDVAPGEDENDLKYFGAVVFDF